MMTPLQISNQRFVPNGKGGYRSSDVDAFVQKVYKNYAKLYNDNIALNDKLEAVSPMVDEYNKTKAAIANALISAQTVADTKLSQAQDEAKIIIDAANKNAEAIVAAKKEEAEKYYIEKTKDADIKLRELEYAFSRLQKEADDYREQYLAKVNAQVDALIASANEKAASIVAHAYSDAKTARDKADEVVAVANKQLDELKAETAKVKSELSALILVADSAVKSISDYELVQDKTEYEATEAASVINKSDIEPFNMEFKYEPVAYEEPVTDTSKAFLSDDAVAAIEPEEETDDEVVVNVLDENVVGGDEMVDLFSHSSETKKQVAQMPDVTSYLSKIFDSATEDDDDDTFGFEDLISESAKF